MAFSLHAPYANDRALWPFRHFQFFERSGAARKSGRNSGLCGTLRRETLLLLSGSA
jgi:hypothetical protein